MAIHISGWTICPPDELIARQYDNLRRIEVAGDIPEGYSWDLLLCHGTMYDAIPLQADSGGLSVALTASQCSESGTYYIQLRGAAADGAVRHTNVVSAIVPSSLSGTASWPTIPSEFEALEARMRDLASHPPIPGEDGKWQIWDVDAGKYVQSDFVAPAGPAGATGPSGSPGIVISDTEPTDPNHPVWLDPDGDASPIPWVPQPATAAVGQIVKVKAVDSEGHITETEAVAMPSGGGGGGAETWEEVSTIPLTAGTAVYNLGSLTTYRKLRIVGSTKLVTTVSGNNWLSINDPNNHTGAALARILIPSNGWLTYINRWIDVARDNLWAEWIGIYANNTAVPQQPTMLRHRVTWPKGETQLVLSLTAETAAAIADGAEITIYGVRA